MRTTMYELKGLLLSACIGGMSVALTACNNDDSNANNQNNAATISTTACESVTTLAYQACQADAEETLLIAQAVCANVADEAERAACLSESQQQDAEELALCDAQKTAREATCNLLGEDHYDPDLAPENFVNPLEIGSTIPVNPWFPLTPGLKWVYEAEDETITVTVLNETIEIDGVTCIVVRDVVEEDGELIEDTLDWFAQDIDGNVWYFGEISKNYEDGELVDLDGSWKSGEDGAKAGILMKAAPQVGDVYRQEWYLAEAEDLAEVVSLDATESAPAASCDGNCLRTHEFTPVEPDASESKFYAAGIGPIVVYDDDEPDSREVLVEFGFE